MKISNTEKIIAYLALISGLTLSAVAEYYSILGLTTIFAAAVIPIVIMGVALGIGKITATIWLKQNWKAAPKSIRVYLFVAIIVLMLVTSMGIFGFLSKAHSDQSLVSGDVQSKLIIYDEKIRTERENIDAARKALVQLDQQVDQTMGRTTDEGGASRAIVIRRNQQKERTALQKEITTAQANISRLNEEATPIRAEARKVEAEVGPIKYIASFFYGETDPTILERAVTWVIITLIVVFDPLAVILLLASQHSFQSFRKEEEEEEFDDWTDEDFEQLASETFAEIPLPPDPKDLEVPGNPTYRGHSIKDAMQQIDEDIAAKEETPKQITPEEWSALLEQAKKEVIAQQEAAGIDSWNAMIAEAERAVKEETVSKDSPYLWTSHTVTPYVQPEEPEVIDLETQDPETAKGSEVETLPELVEGSDDLERPGDYVTAPVYVQNEEQSESGNWKKITEAKTISEEEYIAKANENKNK